MNDSTQSSHHGQLGLELDEYFTSNHHLFEGLFQPDLRRIIKAIELGAKKIHHEISRAGLGDVLGLAFKQNVQGEHQQKLDILADSIFFECMKNRLAVGGICSEEQEHITCINPDARYVLLIDPLDGSSNIEVNIPVGTVFCILPRITPIGTTVTCEDFLQPGNAIVVAGYVIYGISTILVLAIADRVIVFTLDPAVGNFFLTQHRLQFPKSLNSFSINDAYYNTYPVAIQKFLQSCQCFSNDACDRLLYIGSLVSDFHRSVVSGGIFLYPQTLNAKDGKLRLLYEANPISFIAELAGGKSINGYQRIKDIIPTSLHQRTPLIVGNSDLVDKVATQYQIYP